MAATHQLLLLLLLSFKTGFSAEIHVFVKTGDSVQLDIQTQEPPKFTILSWEKGKGANLVTYISARKKVTPDSSYENRLEFNNETFSVTLKNMQESDSGLYTAIEDTGKNVSVYRVSVINAVEAPDLEINSNSSDSCTVNFTCRTQNLMINSSYQNNRCSPEEVTSHINTLILHCSEESIICNYSNPVSWRDDRRNITDLCDKDNRSTDGLTKTFPVWGIIVIIGSVLAIVIISVIVYLIKCKNGKNTTENNPQNEPQEIQLVNSESNPYACPDRFQEQKREEVGERPETTYCMVGQHQKPRVPIETDHTVYSTVCKQPAKKQPTVYDTVSVHH